jgi:hypothetical protein
MALLAPLNEQQKALVELVGGVFANEPGTWPTFDYLEAQLEKTGVDARDILTSFPTIMVPGPYCAVWIESGWNTWPQPGHRVALTLVGMHHCIELTKRFPRDFSIPQFDLVQGYFELINYAAAERRSVQATPTGVRKTEIASGPAISTLQKSGFYFDRFALPILFEMIDKEPGIPFGGGGMEAAGSWTRQATRRVNEFEGIRSIEDYLARLALEQPPERRPQLATPSPLELVTALDYLDTVWQLAFKKPLFRHRSAERTAKLSHGAQTLDELGTRLSALAEVLRGGRDAIPKPRAKDTPERPLKSIERYLVNQLGAASQTVVEDNVRTLECIVAVRDQGQHIEAGTRAAAALVELGIGFPITSPGAVWVTFQAQAVEALAAIRDEIQVHIAAQTATP